MLAEGFKSEQEHPTNPPFEVSISVGHIVVRTLLRRSATHENCRARRTSPSPVPAGSKLNLRRYARLTASCSAWSKLLRTSHWLSKIMVERACALNVGHCGSPA